MDNWAYFKEFAHPPQKIILAKNSGLLQIDTGQ
jgi:hypothetical protein